nr:predicted protein [Ipomoea batatas]
MRRRAFGRDERGDDEAALGANLVSATGGAAVAAVDEEDLAARRTGGVRSEPSVNTSDVEAVAAVRQDSDFVSGGELREANGAFGEFGGEFGGEAELGEGLEDLLLQAFVGRRRRRIGGSGRDPADPGAASDGGEAEDAN